MSVLSYPVHKLRAVSLIKSEVHISWVGLVFEILALKHIVHKELHSHMYVHMNRCPQGTLGYNYSVVL